MLRSTGILACGATGRLARSFYLVARLPCLTIKHCDGYFPELKHRARLPVARQPRRLCYVASQIAPAGRRMRVRAIRFVKLPLLTYAVGGALLFPKSDKRSIGMGKKVVVLCSLEISRMVWRKRSCSAIGSLLIMAAAWTIFSAA